MNKVIVKWTNALQEKHKHGMIELMIDKMDGLTDGLTKKQLYGWNELMNEGMNAD